MLNNLSLIGVNNSLWLYYLESYKKSIADSMTVEECFRKMKGVWNELDAVDLLQYAIVPLMLWMTDQYKKCSKTNGIIGVTLILVIQ